MSDARERAWSDVHDLLPAGWQVGPVVYSHDRSRPVWRVTARGPLRGRRKPPETIDAEGEDELAALTYLVLALREYSKPDQMASLERRARLAYLKGAEEHSQRDHGRGLTEDELRRVMRRYPGDPPEIRQP